MADRKIEDINSDDIFNTKWEETKTKDQRVCIDFTATWCGPCKAIAPVFDKLSKQYPNIRFWRVDFDKCKGAAAKHSVQAVPTFLFCIGGSVVRKFTGAAQQKLYDGVKALAEKSKEELVSSAGDNTAEEADESYEGDLSRFIDMSRSECLNDDPSHPFSNLWQEGTAGTKFLKSDTDEQLLFTVAFKSIVSLKNIKIVAPSDGTGPKKVKLFVNKLNISFDDASEYKATQEFDVTAEDLKSGIKPVQLDSVKFVKTDTLTVFVKSNQGDQEHTVINQIVLWGRKA